MNDEILDMNREDVDYQRQVASKGLRFANYMADLILVGVPISFLTNYLVYGDWYSEGDIVNHLDLYALYTLLYYLFYVTYYTVMEHTTGKTIGKMMTGTHVINHQGGKPTLSQIVGRSFARLIPFQAFSFLGQTGIGWHDSLNKTYVIKD